MGLYVTSKISYVNRKYYIVEKTTLSNPTDTAAAIQTLYSAMYLKNMDTKVNFFVTFYKM